MPNLPLTRSQRVMGSMRFGLLAIGLSTLIKGISYFPPLRESSRAPSHWLEHFFPLQAIGAVWIIAGVMCLLAVWCHRVRTLAWSMVMALHTAWAVSFTLNWVLYQGRAWVSALSYATIVALIFWGLARDNRQPGRE